MFRRKSLYWRVHEHIPVFLLAAVLVGLVPDEQAQTAEEPLPRTLSYTWRSWTREDGLRGSKVWAIAALEPLFFEEMARRLAGKDGLLAVLAQKKLDALIGFGYALWQAPTYQATLNP